MQQCPNCGKVYDESEYAQCPYCSGEKSYSSSSYGSGCKIRMYDKKLNKYRFVSEDEYSLDPDRYE